MGSRYWDDFTVGTEAELGAVTVDEAEVRAFANRYDPQPFHTDPTAAQRWPYGGLIASGWHTAAMTMRLVVDNFIDPETSLGSPGLGPISWKLPVRPGDTLAVRMRVVDRRRSTSRPDRGTITLECTVRNQRDEVVMLIENWIGIVRVRPDVPSEQQQPAS